MPGKYSLPLNFDLRAPVTPGRIGKKKPEQGVPGFLKSEQGTWWLVPRWLWIDLAVSVDTEGEEEKESGLKDSTVFQE